MPRKSIYLSDEVMPIIACDEARGFSSRLTGIITDWHSIIADAMPELTLNEWLFLMDMLNGVVLEVRHATFLANDVAESGLHDGLSEKFELDGMKFAKTIDKLPLAGKIAIHDVAYRFWQRHGIVSDWTEVLTKCGARIKK